MATTAPATPKPPANLVEGSREWVNWMNEQSVHGHKWGDIAANLKPLPTIVEPKPVTPQPVAPLPAVVRPHDLKEGSKEWINWSNINMAKGHKWGDIQEAKPPSIEVPKPAPAPVPAPAPSISKIQAQIEAITPSKPSAPKVYTTMPVSTSKSTGGGISFGAYTVTKAPTSTAPTVNQARNISLGLPTNYKAPAPVSNPKSTSTGIMGFIRR